MTVSTPCVGVCRLDDRDICIGCGRTIRQIAAWSGLDEGDRRQIMAALEASRNSLGASGAGPAQALPQAQSLRIVSLLPAATEMAFALGLAEAVVGVSHECNFPAPARNRPTVVRPALALEHLSQREIDVAVSQRLATGRSLYEIDERLLQQLQPTLILTQDLCQVCAPSGRELAAALGSLRPQPSTLAMSPHGLEDIFGNLRDLGRATDRLLIAERLIDGYRKRLARLQAAVPRRSERKRVFFMEWADPVYCSGHWVPEMIALAGGVDTLARAGSDSVRVEWKQVLESAPELLILSPCGCDLEQAHAQLPLLMGLPGWSTLPAVQQGQVFCVDANAYFARPGPRVIEGTELLAHLIHPELFGWSGPSDAYRRLAAPARSVS